MDLEFSQSWKEMWFVEKSLFHTLTVVIDRAEAVNTLHPCHIFISLTSVMGKEKCQLHALSPCHLVSTLQP